MEFIAGMDMWEYFCYNCGHLRLSVDSKKPILCKNCSSDNILIGRPDTLDADALRDEFYNKGDK
jgi:DNA-directed RNA polymerase subunit RPC12/RpoP